jgi:hypothetical protein
MILTENPFFILGVSTSDTREKIIEQADARSLEIDASICTQAKSTLTHPKNRLFAEVTWLAGVSPHHAKEIIEKIKHDPVSLSVVMKDMEPLSKCNLMAFAISVNNYKDLDVWINFLCFTFNQININSIFNLINGNRKLANFSAISNPATVEDEFNNYKKFISGTIIKALDKVEKPEVILTNVLNHITSSVTMNIPEIVSDFVSDYHLEIKKYLEAIDGEIQKIMQSIILHLREVPSKDVNINSKILKIQYLLKFWSEIVMPIQINNVSNGIEEDDSIQMFQKIRQLALYLSNNNLLHKPAYDLIDVLQKIFQKYQKFNELLLKDKEALQNLLT